MPGQARRLRGAADHHVARSLIESLSLDGLTRIDAALEGDWSGTVSTVWTRDHGLLGFGAVPQSHPEYVPSIELIFADCWVGLRCSAREDDRNVFDEALARRIIDLVERRLRF